MLKKCRLERAAFSFKATLKTGELTVGAYQMHAPKRNSRRVTYIPYGRLMIHEVTAC
jgi:hypothetical protein